MKILALIFVLIAAPCLGQNSPSPEPATSLAATPPATSSFTNTSTTVPNITDLFSADEIKDSGLPRLNPSEIGALNAAIFCVLIVTNSKSEPLATVGESGEASETGDVDFYDSQGRAVAYIAEDSNLTIICGMVSPSRIWTRTTSLASMENVWVGLRAALLSCKRSRSFFD
jgi:hypothetical protein